MKPTILVIEDNTEIRENIQEILELSDYSVITAENGVEGVRQAKTQPVDLIICDIMMPELDGYGVLRILSKSKDTLNVPFIFLTAKTEMSDLRRGMALGAYDYILKPFDDVQLLDSIEMRLKKSANRPEAEHASDWLWSRERVEQDLRERIQHCEERVFGAYERIFHEGQHPHMVYYLEHGRVKVSKINDMGKEWITEVVSAGALFGYGPALQNIPHSEQAMTLEECAVRCVPKDDFLTWAQDPKIALYLLNDGMLRRSLVEQKALDFAYNSVRGKVANTLRYLWHIYRDKGSAKITLRRDDLAALAGVAKETLIRALSQFKEEDILQVDGSVILITDPSKLDKIIY